MDATERAAEEVPLPRRAMPATSPLAGLSRPHHPLPSLDHGWTGGQPDGALSAQQPLDLLERHIDDGH